jgi:hypothetical protein
MKQVVGEMNYSQDLLVDFAQWLTTLRSIMEKEFPAVRGQILEEKLSHFNQVIKHVLRLFGKDNDSDPETVYSIRGQIRWICERRMEGQRIDSVQKFTKELMGAAFNVAQELQRAAQFGLKPEKRSKHPARDNTPRYSNQQKQALLACPSTLLRVTMGESGSKTKLPSLLSVGAAATQVILRTSVLERDSRSSVTTTIRRWNGLTLREQNSFRTVTTFP